MDDVMDLYGDLEDRVKQLSEDTAKVGLDEEVLDSDGQSKVDNGEDIYDYLYTGGNCTGDIYDNMLDHEGNAAMVKQIKVLENDVRESKEYTNTLESQIVTLTNLNKELRQKNINYDKNLSSLKITARNEVNRKNEQIVNLKKELDNILFRRSGQNIDKEELKEILYRHKSSSCSGCLARIPMPVKKRQFQEKRKEHIFIDKVVDSVERAKLLNKIDNSSMKQLLKRHQEMKSTKDDFTDKSKCNKINANVHVDCVKKYIQF